MNASVLKTDCALGIFWIERRLVLTCFPCRTRTVLLPLVGDLSRCFRKWKKWLTWFLLAVPKSHYLALTLHFISLVLSDHHLIQPGRSSPQLSACTENWGFDRQVFQGNYLCRECTEQYSATKLFDVSTQIQRKLEKLWWPVSACQYMPLCIKHFDFSEAQRGVWEAAQCHSSHTSWPCGWHTCDGWLSSERTVCPSFLCPTNQSSPECGVRSDQVLKTHDCFHSPLLHLSAKISLAPMQLLALNFLLCLQVTPGSEAEWSQIVGLKSG